VARELPVDEPDLSALAALAGELEAPRLADAARATAARILEGRFHVACVGQFKRGKSTLLNALLGRELLPVGVTPVTSVPTLLRHGVREHARVRFDGGNWHEAPLGDLALFVSERHNPQNALGVAAVEVFAESPLLESGMCLVDTPGIGSIFAGNTRATHAFLPAVDAAVVVLGADPPISGDEMALVAEVARRVPDVVFVLNKADRIAGAECVEAALFTERVLAERLGRSVPGLLHVSAAERLAGAGPERDWPALVRALERLAEDAGAGLLRAAGRRETLRLADRLLAEADERRGALVRPRAESERRIADLAASLRGAEQAMGDLGHLLQAEVDRLAKRFEADREAFLAEVVPAASARLRATIAGLPDRGLRAASLEAARGLARARLDAWVADETPAAERLYEESSSRFVAFANAFLARFLGSGEIASEAGFRERSRLFFTDLLAVTSPPPLAGLFDRLLPIGRRRRAAMREAGRVLERLLSSNGSRVEQDLAERARESRRKLEADLRARLRDAHRSATAALELARARQAAGEESVRAELERLESIRSRVLEIRRRA
jgi:hypothetical protein